MALQFDATPYLQMYQQRRAEELANRPDPNAITQNLMQSMQLLSENRRQQQLLDLAKAKEGRELASSAMEQRKFDSEYGTPIAPGAMFAQPGGTARSSFMPGGQGQVGQAGSLIDAFNTWRAGGMKGPAQPEFMGALGKDERKTFFDRQTPNDPLDEQLKRSQIAKNLRETGESQKPPPGYRWAANGSLEAIPGGPAEAKIAGAQEKADAAIRGMKDQADLVIGKVDQALSKVGLNTAGLGGSIMGMVPGSESKNLDADLDTIRAVLGFNTLAEMRKASPTGGALGAISERELKLLTAARASLDQAQSPAQLRERLAEIKTHYQNWLNTVEQADTSGTNVPAVGGTFEGKRIKRVTRKS